MADRPRVVFLGSGPVAAKSLELLLQHCDIEAVITKPRPAHHTGTSPVIELAAARQLSMHTVSSKSELDQLITDTPFRSNIAILIDFGIIVSRHTIASFELGIINSHFSLLPQLRGADPISFAILEGRPKTGVSLMCIDEGMDTGKLIAQRTIHINPHETSPALTEHLITLSDTLLREYLPRYVAGMIKPRSQPHPDRATYTRKLTKADGIVDWREPAEVIERKVRALQPWPRTRTKLGKIDAIITSACVLNDSSGLAPGSIISDGRSLRVQTGHGLLEILRIQPVGKKEMPTEAFLRGYASQL